MSEPFAADTIVALLTELGQDLNAQGIRGDLFIVGGAAMALAFSTRRSTRDIDGVFEPKTEIYAAAGRMALRHGLSADWLNDAVKGLLPGPDPDAQEILDLPGLRVSVPPPRYLLALKVASARVDRDIDDIRILAERCGLSTARSVLDLTVSIVGAHRPLAPKVAHLIEEMFPESSSPA